MTVENSRSVPPARSLTETRTVRRRNNSNRAGWLAAVALASVAAFEGGVLYVQNFSNNSGDNDPRATDSATARPSDALATASPVVSSSPEARASATASPVVSSSPEATASATANPEHLNAIRVESAEAAALRFGADVYSSDPSNWEINEYGGAHLKETEKAVKVNLAGTVAEGWIKSNMVGARDALTFVANSDVVFVETNGLTLWDFGGNPKGFAQVWEQVKAKEAVEQPDVTVIPLCGEFQPIETVDVPLVKISSPAEAAAMFGADVYSSDPSNWEINEYGGAHLIDNPNGNASLVNLNGAVGEGWIKANRENGRNAITFVAHPDALQVRFVGGTIWEFTDADRGYEQLLGQVLTKEAVEQPDVNVYNVCLPTVAQ